MEKYIIDKIKLLGDTIYHYTSLNTLINILKSKEFWLFSTAQMNDKLEQKYFIEDLQQKIKQQISEDSFEKCDSIFNKIYKRLDFEYPYAMCFSLLEDDASQWERYSNNGMGVRIGFNTENIVKLFCNGYSNLTKISYGFDSSQHAHFNVLKKYIVEEEITEGFSNERQIIDNVLACSTMHKHIGFQTEQECRITTFWGHFLMKNSTCDFVVIRDVARRVLKVKVDQMCAEQKINFEDLFESVLLGPKSVQNEIELRAYLKTLGYNNLAENTHKSKCPLR